MRVLWIANVDVPEQMPAVLEEIGFTPETLTIEVDGLPVEIRSAHHHAERFGVSFRVTDSRQARHEVYICEVYNGWSWAHHRLNDDGMYRLDGQLWRDYSAPAFTSPRAALEDALAAIRRATPESDEA